MATLFCEKNGIVIELRERRKEGRREGMKEGRNEGRKEICK